MLVLCYYMVCQVQAWCRNFLSELDVGMRAVKHLQRTLNIIATLWYNERREHG